MDFIRVNIVKYIKLANISVYFSEVRYFKIFFHDGRYLYEIKFKRK